MATIRLRTFADYARYGCHVRITCIACGRTAVFEPQALAMYFRKRNWNSALDIAHIRFCCTGAPGDAKGCGSRDVRISPQSNGLPLRPEPPRPMRIMRSACPAGIDLTDWDRADEIERKKLVDRLRG